eukprot:COSAG02_NODE_17665_length_988_cov_1.516310_2_plen_41_part_01
MSVHGVRRVRKYKQEIVCITCSDAFRSSTSWRLPVPLRRLP